MPFKRVRFALQKDSFCNLKGVLLKAKRSPFKNGGDKACKTSIFIHERQTYLCDKQMLTFYNMTVVNFYDLIFTFAKYYEF